MKRLPTRRAAVAALAGALPACLRQGDLKGGKPVSTLELTLSAARTDLVSGESLALRALLQNRGPAPVRVQTFPDVPLTFEFRDAATGELRFRCSHAAFDRALTAGMQMPPAPPPQFDTLAPGQSRQFFEDPALYLRQVLPPGRYLLVARLGGPDYEITSAPLEIRVSPLRASHTAAAYCVYRNAMLALCDHANDGEPWIFYRETQTGPQVEAAVAARLEKASARVRGMAVSIHTAPGLQGRWIAWLEEGVLKARRVSGDAIMASPAAAATALDDARLGQPGFHLADGSGLFILAGTAGGEARLRFARITDGGLRMSSPTLLKGPLPARLLAQSLHIGETVSLWLAWAQETEGVVRILARAFDLEGSPLAPGPREVYSREARLLACELAGFGFARPAFAHALIQVPPRDQLVYVRAPLEGDAPVQQLRVPDPPKPPGAWAISGYETGGLVVLAAIEDRIWVASARGRAWEPLTPPVGRIERLHLMASNTDYWGALWLDPDTGLRGFSDPMYRARE